MESDSGTPRLFAYPRAVHERRHAPLGYLDYGDYKPWLRDEFQFHCDISATQITCHACRHFVLRVETRVRPA